jgi:hypothetical protein
MVDTVFEGRQPREQDAAAPCFTQSGREGHEADNCGWALVLCDISSRTARGAHCLGSTSIPSVSPVSHPQVAPCLALERHRYRVLGPQVVVRSPQSQEPYELQHAEISRPKHDQGRGRRGGCIKAPESTRPQLFSVINQGYHCGPWRQVLYETCGRMA